MLLVTEQTLAELEAAYPGIVQTILWYESAQLPACPQCGSADTARVAPVMIGRTLSISQATSKFKAVVSPWRTKEHYCRACSRFFA